jgi:biopolymer transport protein ExbD
VDEANLPDLLKIEASKTPQPDLHIRGDRDVRYERVAQAMASAQHAGLRKIGFITEPKRTVTISHNGEIDRLQETRLGKLILTK